MTLGFRNGSTFARRDSFSFPTDPTKFLSFFVFQRLKGACNVVAQFYSASRTTDVAGTRNVSPLIRKEEQG